MTIIENRTYTPADPEWEAVIAGLREGDEVEAWWGNSGGRGKVVTSRGDSIWLESGTIREAGGVVWHGLSSLTVTKLAPREPSWAGARVVLDKTGVVWQSRSGDMVCVSFPLGKDAVHRDLDEVEAFGPITVLLDAEGRIPVDSVLSVNGVTRDDLIRVLRRWLAAEAVDAILAALGGAR